MQWLCLQSVSWEMSEKRAQSGKRRDVKCLPEVGPAKIGLATRRRPFSLRGP